MNTDGSLEQSKMSMVRLPTDNSVISLLATISTVFGCGIVSSGQESSRDFTVTEFTTLPIAMVYSGRLKFTLEFLVL
ncbi:hypothetical protein KIN20_025055 [Parelaphostrongylus tenuis]|uniref:Uncharacterized protein n=1 Tax=Parelaphostrongylus tenuis TaxID=148309 RepID=A0AAD5N8U6_PARTN|nr:hypothetical protein KIN20_025055 [Parelaphostrongylus tenuis]